MIKENIAEPQPLNSFKNLNIFLQFNKTWILNIQVLIYYTTISR